MQLWYEQRCDTGARLSRSACLAIIAYNRAQYPFLVMIVIRFFFFQAEDGIRDLTVTGVQTCALPIYFRHIPFGNVLGEDRKLMKTRSGENVPLRQVLEEACARARKIIEEKNPNLADAEKVDIARTIGIGAVKYADLSQYRMTDYVFSWDKMLALQGNTAPYLQNAYVRVRSIFRKAGEAAAKIEKFVLSEAAETTLAKRLCQFAEIVPQVLNDFRPNILANYLFELANSFHAFYQTCPVLRSDEPVRSSRLALCDLTGRILQRGLNLLGIKVPEKM